LPSAGHADRQHHALDLLREWITAVDEHGPGEHDAALERVSKWRDDEVESMLDYVQAFAGLPTPTWRAAGFPGRSCVAHRRLAARSRSQR
jgi:hypothetical protein